MQSFKCAMNGGLTPFRGSRMHDVICERFERNRLEKYANTAVVVLNMMFVSAMAETSFFIFRISLINYRSYKYKSLGLFFCTFNEESG